MCSRDLGRAPLPQGAWRAPAGAQKMGPFRGQFLRPPGREKNGSWGPFFGAKTVLPEGWGGGEAGTIYSDVTAAGEAIFWLQKRGRKFGQKLDPKPGQKTCPKLAPKSSPAPCRKSFPKGSFLGSLLCSLVGGIGCARTPPIIMHALAPLAARGFVRHNGRKQK